MLEEILKKKLFQTLQNLQKKEWRGLKEIPEILFEQPKLPAHGDLSCNIALQLAGKLQISPRIVAEMLVARLQPVEWLEKIETAGPGFINFFIHPWAYFKMLAVIAQQGKNFGRVDLGANKKVLIEFVSANPTGPLNIVSARAAALGGVLAALLDFAGYRVAKEFYVNDMGNQIELFGRSLYARYAQALGREEPVPEEGYHGDYLQSLGKTLAQKEGPKWLKKDPQEAADHFKKRGLEKMLTWQKKSLSDFGVVFDRWFLQSSLFKKKKIERCLEKLKKGNHIYFSEGAWFFRSTAFGDDKDRVVIKQDGETTYFASDIAYHADKFERKFDHLIDIFGPDHHGYIARTKAVVQALGFPAESLTVLIAQQVNLLEGATLVKMSKRAGKLVTLDQLIEEVGKDVARYFFLMRTANTPLDFDLELAKSETPENPVFYIQYAHARIASVFRKAAERKLKFSFKHIIWKELDLPEEKELAQTLLSFPKGVAEAAKEWEPHRVAFYLLTLAKIFQGYYSKGKGDPRYQFLSASRSRTEAKLYLLKNTQIVLKNALTLLGIAVPDRMYREEHDEG